MFQYISGITSTNIVSLSYTILESFQYTTYLASYESSEWSVFAVAVRQSYLGTDILFIVRKNIMVEK